MGLRKSKFVKGSQTSLHLQLQILKAKPSVFFIEEGEKPINPKPALYFPL
jgi:hypothetical protein